jgi:flagellar protein FliJ
VTLGGTCLRTGTLRARRVGIDDTRQRIAQVEAIVADFDRTANELEGWIRSEQNRTRIHDPAHFAYSTFAIAMTRRRDALKRSRETLRCSIDELQRQLSGADVTVESPISLRRRKPSP